MGKIEKFEDLVVWQKAMDLAELSYRATAAFSPADLDSIGNQLRRATQSIPANVAEGFGRRSRASYRAHVAIALGSHAEARTHVLLMKRPGLLNSAQLDQLLPLIDFVGRLRHGLWRALNDGAGCYSVSSSFVLPIGLWPAAIGLLHALC